MPSQNNRSSDSSKSQLIPLIVIIGPTAVGKTELSIELAQRLDGEIISADSRLFYRGMDIGTAKPSLEDRARVPHHLIDVAEPDDVWSLARFQRQVQWHIDQIYQRGNLPFLVGGSGQYIRAVIEGWQIPKVRPDPRLRAALDAWVAEIGAAGLHDRLAALDPQAAEKIDPRNVRRTIRALEVVLSSGRRFSEQRRSGQPTYNTLMLGLSRPRPELYQRIDERIENMIASGLVEEVRELLDRGYSPETPTLSAIGYREILAFLAGENSLEEAVVLMKRATRVFVRRQANWFKPNAPEIQWFEFDPDIIDKMESAITRFIESLNLHPLHINNQ
ncbi:MAG: tRNA (adenosine(37)-N6)-dimethylallyltransferase MiaA [Chloroflexota bacterium]|nr:tRNA (adenosine(37)-N6)-dimethylallyltransferase MiaA [Chloroflexota bacterium]